MPLPENIDATFLDQSTGDALHQQHHDALHAAYNDPATNWPEGNAAYRADSSPLVCDAGRMRAPFGSPSATVLNGWPIYSLPDGSFSAVSGTVEIPAGWTSVNVAVVLANLGAAGGNFAYRAYTPQQSGDGDTVASLVILSDSAVAAGAQNVKSYLTVATARAVTPGKPLNITFGRRGADATDTATTALGIFEFRVTKA